MKSELFVFLGDNLVSASLILEIGSASWACHLCSPTGSTLRRALYLVKCSVVTLMKFWAFFEQGAPYFHFVHTTLCSQSCSETLTGLGYPKRRQNGSPLAPLACSPSGLSLAIVCWMFVGDLAPMECALEQDRSTDSWPELSATNCH